MINKTELRIGNTVQLKNGMQLVIIEMGVYSLKVDIVGGNTYVGATYENLQGIPLSPEILERYGFVRDDREDSVYDTEVVYTKDGIDIYDKRESGTGFCYATYTRYPGKGFKSGYVISSLHQLQNLYFALCGTELTAREG